MQEIRIVPILHDHNQVLIILRTCEKILLVVYN